MRESECGDDPTQLCDRLLELFIADVWRGAETQDVSAGICKYCVLAQSSCQLGRVRCSDRKKSGAAIRGDLHHARGGRVQIERLDAMFQQSDLMHADSPKTIRRQALCRVKVEYRRSAIVRRRVVGRTGERCRTTRIRDDRRPTVCVAVSTVASR